MSDQKFGGIPVVAPEAPDVMIAMVDVLRAAVHPAPAEQDDDEIELAWSLQGRPMAEGDRRRLLLYGDLTLQNSRWFIGVTSVAGIDFRGKLASAHEWDDGDAGIDELTQRYGPWASHVLYDVAAAAARKLAAQSFANNLEVPFETPEPLLHLLRDASNNSD